MFVFHFTDAMIKIRYKIDENKQCKTISQLKYHQTVTNIGKMYENGAVSKREIG